MGPIRGLRKRKRKVKRAEERVDMDMDMDKDVPHVGSDWWDEFSKRITGPLSTSKEGMKFESIFKITRRTFNYICSIVKDDILAKPGNFTCKNGKQLSVNDLVAIALRRLSSGDSLLTVGNTFGLNQSTVSQVTWRFVEIIEEKAIHHLSWPDSDEELKNIKAKFEKIHGLPNCCGIIDTTHIVMCLPSVDSTNDIWIDREKKHSMVLQAVVDPKMRFRDILTGWPGSMSEPLVLRNSGFFDLCEKGVRLNGKRLELSEESELREYIIGDSAFPLLPWLITPYQGARLSDSKTEFNKRHCATMVVAQRAFARLKEMWKIFQGEMWRPDKHKLPRMILVCCILHNITVDMEDEVWNEIPLSVNHDTRYKQQFCDFTDKNAYRMRDELSRFLSKCHYDSDKHWL